MISGLLALYLVFLRLHGGSCPIMAEFHQPGSQNMPLTQRKSENTLKYLTNVLLSIFL